MGRDRRHLFLLTQHVQTICARFVGPLIAAIYLLVCATMLNCDTHFCTRLFWLCSWHKLPCWSALYCLKFRNVCMYCWSQLWRWPFFCSCDLVVGSNIHHKICLFDLFVGNIIHHNICLFGLFAESNIHHKICLFDLFVGSNIHHKIFYLVWLLQELTPETTDSLLLT